MSELPAGWSTARIQDLIDGDGLFADGDWVESKDQDPNGAIRLLQLADVGDGRFINKSRRYVNDQKFKELNCSEVFEGDVLVARMPDPLGRACLVPELPNRSITVVDVAILRPGKTSVHPKWLMHFINSTDVRQTIELLSSGTTRKRISRSNLAKIELPIPPAAEQKRIADKLDALLAKVDACRRRLDRVPQLIKRFRQAVLAAATAGELTTDWREKCDSSALVDKMQAIEGFSFPLSWKWDVVSKFCSSVRDGTHDTPKYVDDGIPLITSKNIRPTGIDFCNTKLISFEDHQEISKRSNVEKGDILFSMIGSVGHVCLIETTREFSVKNVGIFKKNPNVIVPKYLFYLYV